MSLWNCCLLCHFLWLLLLLDSLLLILDILLLSVKHWSAHSCTFQFVFVLIIFSSLLKWFGSYWDFDICGIRMSYSVYPSLSKHISLFNSYVDIYSLFAFSLSMHNFLKLKWGVVFFCCQCTKKEIMWLLCFLGGHHCMNELTRYSHDNVQG